MKKPKKVVVPSLAKVLRALAEVRACQPAMNYVRTFKTARKAWEGLLNSTPRSFRKYASRKEIQTPDTTWWNWLLFKLFPSERCRCSACRPGYDYKKEMSWKVIRGPLLAWVRANDPEHGKRNRRVRK